MSSRHTPYGRVSNENNKTNCTRGKTRHWKTGFYFIALQAQVPIVLAYMDYSCKVSGLGPVFVPTGDVERDMLEIKRFYAGIRGRNEDQFSAH